jgi:hypothetical protein
MQSNKKLLLPMLGVAILAGAGVGLYGITNAQTADTTTTAQSVPAQQQIDPSKGGHIGSNGTKEELLTGDNAAKATAAALAAVPGGTIERVETDAEGDVYEAHMVKSDGTHVTVKFDSNFNVTKTESGHGGPRGTNAQ